MKTKPTKISSELQPLFWSYDFQRLDLAKNKQTVITNVINYGDLPQWRWLAGAYGRMEVRDVLNRIPAAAIKPRARKLAGIIFNIKKFNYAPRGIKRKRT